MKSLLTAIVLALTNAGGAFAQDYPSRPITMIVPFAAGGAADAIGRIMANGISRHIGQPVVVENIGGAGGATGSARVKNAKPDGYTIGLGSMGTHAASVQINPKLRFDPRTDFDYLGLVSSTPNALFVRKDFPASTLKEYVAYAKATGKDLKLGHSGIGSAPHITIVFLSQLIGVEPTMVAYRGFGQTIYDILSGTIDGSCDLVAAVSGHVQGGSVKALVVAVDERSPAVPDVPTANEAGFPEFKVETWTGLYAPKGAPLAAIAKLSRRSSRLWPTLRAPSG
jgi:tripartite-type tricarboxylate transporter receptor subunit TctC